MNTSEDIYRVAGQIEAIKLWAKARGIAWRKVRPVLKPHDCYGLPDGERLIVTGPAATWVDEIVNDAIQHRLKVEWQPTIPKA